MEFIFTKDKHWLKKWDDFVQTNDKGSHLILSDWLHSYESYNFDFEVCLCLENDLIIGGYGAVIAKVLFFKFYIVPYGPIVAIGHEKDLNFLVDIVLQRARRLKVCYSHITLPFSSVSNSHVYTDFQGIGLLKKAEKGHLFKYVYSSSGFNWVDLKASKEPEILLQSFKSSVRRDIRNSFRKNLKARFLYNQKDIELAYQLCLENALNGNYSIREWEVFKEVLLRLIKNDIAKFIAAYQKDEMKGAILVIKSGNYYTYVVGATKKEKPDLLVGHFLQWEAILLSLKSDFDGYNISLGGSEGVQKFKNGFSTEQILFENSKFHWVLNPFIFKMYLVFNQYMKPYKKKIARILSMIKK
jgi:lipid II:glycine glycyltransferase (peptidoglycan interpeptide bridge formation enzyme)